MSRYLGIRLGLLIAVLFGVLVVTFIMTRLMPGSPVEMMLGSKATAAQIAAKRTELGLDKPVLEQFIRYVISVTQGDFGTSFHTKRPVAEDIMRRASATVELVTLSLLLAVALGTPLGLVAGVRQSTLVDVISRVVATFGMALPWFLTGMVLQIVFYGQLSVLPLQGRLSSEFEMSSDVHRYSGMLIFDTILSGNFAAFWDAIRHLALPVLTLSIASLGVIMRVTRNVTVEVMSQDYITMSRALGIKDNSLHWKYAFRATLIPLLTVVGLTYGYLLGGAVVVEYLFDWPGLGGYAVNAIIFNDYPAVMAVTFILAAANLFVNLTVDVLYFALDPRTRLS